MLQAFMEELRRVFEREHLLRKTAEELAAALQQNHAVLVAELLHLQARVRELEVQQGVTSGNIRDPHAKANAIHFDVS